MAVQSGCTERNGRAIEITRGEQCAVGRRHRSGDPKRAGSDRPRGPRAGRATATNREGPSMGHPAVEETAALAA
jgi:hypothetical protein